MTIFGHFWLKNRLSCILLNIGSFDFFFRFFLSFSFFCLSLFFWFYFFAFSFFYCFSFFILFFVSKVPGVLCFLFLFYKHTLRLRFFGRTIGQGQEDKRNFKHNSEFVMTCKVWNDGLFLGFFQKSLELWPSHHTTSFSHLTHNSYFPRWWSH